MVSLSIIFCGAILFFSEKTVCCDANIDKTENQIDIKIDFETRLAFYLDLKTKRFFKKMSIKEKLLMELIQSVVSAIKERGKSGVIEGDVRFDLIYGKSESILEQYNEEIQAIKKIVNELDNLELTIQKIDDQKLLEEIEELKDHLMKILDDQKLATKRLTKEQLAKMIGDYSKEIERLLQIYEKIDLFQKRANYVGDIEIVKQLNLQKQRIIKILEESRIAGSSPDKIVENYIEEATSIVHILKQIDLLEERVEADSTLKTNIDEVRNNIISSIDKRIIELFGYMDGDNFTGRTISDHFKTWKAERTAEYQVKFTKYKILMDNLIRTGTSKERNRMLERDITNALLNYSDKNYELAEMLFKQIYDAYKDYYTNLDGVIFYRSEANYANHYYDAAREGYLEIINNYPNSQYVGQSYLRLMIISYTYGWNNEFFKYFDKVKDCLNIDREDLNKANYLAGYLYINQNQYQDAKSILENIKDASKYYIPARYLQGIVFTNLEKYAQAKKIFEQIINQKNYPWTDLNYSIFKNESLLKLGYLHYQRGEYHKATSYFDQVSKGYKGYDASLIGQAWANLKKGHYDNAVNKVDLICNNYLLSNYVYEAIVLSAHCKRIQNRTNEAIEDLRYVANAKYVLGKVQEYNEERKRILKQLDELELLEETILEHQNRKLYSKVVKIRDLINNALLSFRYRGAISSRLLEEYYDERKILIRQIEEFDSIITFAKEQGNKEMISEALKQRNRLIAVLEKYQLENATSGVSYFLDYPLATKEGGLIYRREIINKLVNDLILERQRVQRDMEMVTELLSLSNEKARIDAMIDLEIIEEDLRDLNNQLNQFQVWLANYHIEDIKTETEQWANFSGFGISDINFVSFRERIKKISGFSKNLALIDNVLREKRQQLEERIRRFDNEVRKIQREMEAEKIRLEKLEKEKYFQDIYFETKTKEIETEEVESFEEKNWLFNQENGKKF